MEGVWAKLSSELPRGLPRAAFALNQQACRLAALAEAGVPPCEALTAATEAHAAALAAFAEGALEAHLRVWTAWVNRVVADTGVAVEAARGGGGAPPPPARPSPKQLLAALPEGFKPPLDPAEAEAAVRDLGLTWKGALAAINEEVERYFGGAGGKTARDVLKACFSEVAEYHQRGVLLLGRAFPSSPPAWAREMTTIQAIYFEIRRYGRAE